MGYVVTRAKSPDTELISACAQYAAGEDDGGLMRDISRMTAISPEGWRALAEAADHASETNALEAAELVFVMQRSLLGKRNHIRDQLPRIVEPANVNEPFGGPNVQSRHSRASGNNLPPGAPNDVSPAAAAAAFAGMTVDGELAATIGIDPLLAAKIQARQKTAQAIAEAWQPASAYVNAMAILTASDASRVFATA